MMHVMDEERAPEARPEIPLANYGRELAARLAKLPTRPRAAIAAACAERLYPAYAAYLAARGVDDAGTVRRALDAAWEVIEGGAVLDGPDGGVAVRAPDAAALVRACVALIPDEDAGTILPRHAEEAIATAAYALQAAADLADDAGAWAATVAMDALDAFLLQDVATVDAAAEQAVWAHPLVRAEVERREIDLVILAGPDLATAVALVRARAAGTSLLPLDELAQA
jgi:hypothetical protein